MKHPSIIYPLIFLGLLIGGCVRPPPPNTTLNHSNELKPLPNRVDLDGIWYADRMKFYEMRTRFDKIYIKPVNVYPAMEAFQKDESDDRVIEERWEEYNEVAKYASEEFKKAIKNYPNHPLKLADRAGPNTLVLELALVEIKPIDPIYNAAASIGGFFVPGGGLVKNLNTSGVTIEGMLWDGGTGEELVEFRDRRTQKVSPFTIRDYEQYGHVRGAIDDWAEEYAELSATPYEKRVSGSFFVRLNPF